MHEKRKQIIKFSILKICVKVESISHLKQCFQKRNFNGNLSVKVKLKRFVLF